MEAGTANQGMADMSIYVCKPAAYTYPDDFDVFFRQFKTYVKNVGCQEANKLDLLMGFLDNKSYQLVESITFTAAEKTAIAADLDAAFPKLREALTPSNKLPADIELKFRKQNTNESLSDFGFAIKTLGIKAYGNDAMTNAQVIDAFCMGIKNPELSAKLLNAQTQFTTISDALTYAQKKEKTAAVKKYIVQSRQGEQDTTDEHTPGDVSVLTADIRIADRAATRNSPNGSGEGSGYQNAENSGPRNYNQKQSNGLTASNRYRGRGDKFVSRGSNHSSNSHDHIECYHCHEFGHYAANCPRKQTRTAIDCHYCGKLGHIERNCYKKANDERAKTGGNHYRNRGPNKDFQRGPGRRNFQ